jgi:hypothetical protein
MRPPVSWVEDIHSTTPAPVTGVQSNPGCGGRTHTPGTQ